MADASHFACKRTFGKCRKSICISSATKWRSPWNGERVGHCRGLRSNQVIATSFDRPPRLEEPPRIQRHRRPFIQRRHRRISSSMSAVFPLQRGTPAALSIPSRACGFANDLRSYRHACGSWTRLMRSWRRRHAFSEHGPNQTMHEYRTILKAEPGNDLVYSRPAGARGASAVSAPRIN